MRIFDTIMRGLERNMDLRMERQGYINANIANAETPGYRPVDFQFEDELSRVLSARDEDKMVSTRSGHQERDIRPEDVEGEVIEQAGEVSADQNAVDIDRQMAELTNNAFNYRTSAKIVNKKIAFLKYVINESR